MPIYEVKSWNGGLSDYEDRGPQGAHKFGSNLDIRKKTDSLTAGQALKDIANSLPPLSSSFLVDELGNFILQSNGYKIRLNLMSGISPSASISLSTSPSSSISPSASSSPSVSASISPSASTSPSIGTSPSSSRSPSASNSPSASRSPSASISSSSSVSVSPSPSAGLKTTFADLIRFFVKCLDGFVYGFGDTGKIYKIDSNFTCQQVYDCQKQIKGAEEKPSISGKTYLVFATNTELHSKEIPGLANWNDVDKAIGYPKQNLDAVDWHTMKEVGGSIMIANGSKLAMIGYDDSYTNNALQLIPGNLAKTIIDRKGRAIVGTVRASSPSKGINGALDTEVPLAQVGDNGEIYYADMSSSMPVKRFPGGGKVNPGGVTNEVEQVNFFEWEQTALSWIGKQVVGNMALFGVYQADVGRGGIYSYGRKDKNHLITFNLEYQLDVDEVGAIINAFGVTMASYRVGPDCGVTIVDTTKKAVGTYEGLDFRAPIKKPSQITAWDNAELFMSPLPSGASVEFWYRVNKIGKFVQAKLPDGSSSFATANAKKAVFLVGAEGEIFEPRIVLIPTGNSSPEVHRMHIVFH